VHEAICSPTQPFAPVNSVNNSRLSTYTRRTAAADPSYCFHEPAACQLQNCKSMNTRATLVLTGAAAFAGGLIAGILLAPESGHRMRSKLIARMNVPVRWVDDRLDELEGKLHDLENHVEGVRKQVRTATIGRVVPDVPDREAFDVDSAEIARELPRMPKR
jgi:hypothetical protein